MKYLSLTASIAIASLLAACSTTDNPVISAQSVIENDVVFLRTAAAMESIPHETMLLVSLDDGTVVMQKIRSDAAVCFKKNSDSATTCLTQGNPVVDPQSNTVIGFEMIEEHIELIAKTH